MTLPSEWHPQSAILLTWPHNKTDWKPWLAEIQQVYIELVKTITQYQLVVIACHDASIQQQINQVVKANNLDSSMVRTFIAPNNDTWARDHGPITKVDDQGGTQILDFTFNAWGAKYESNLDDLITTALIQQPFCQLQSYQNIDLVLEGGSIESDGNGSLMTTEICLLNPNRNSDLTKEDIEQALKEVFDIQQVLWLSQGHLSGDDTDAHVDTLARFSPDGIVYVQCQDKKAAEYDALQVMEQEIKAFKNTQGQTYKLYPLPMPSPIFNGENEQLPATYANYLIINDAVLVPIYNDDKDQQALDIIQSAYPDRKIIPINCLTVIEQYGSLHCLTMQLPEGLIS